MELATLVVLLYYSVAAQSPDGQQCSAQGYESKITSIGTSVITARSHVICLHYPYSWLGHMMGRGHWLESLYVWGFALVSFAQVTEAPRFATSWAVVLATVAWRPALALGRFLCLAPTLLHQSCHTVLFCRKCGGALFVVMLALMTFMWDREGSRGKSPKAFTLKTSLQGLTCNCKLVRRDHVNECRRCRYLLPEPSTNAYINMSTGHLGYLGRLVRNQSGLTHKPSHFSVRMGLSVWRKSRPKAMRYLKQWR